MPQSVRDQIMAAIAEEVDNGRRAVLLILLAIADQMDGVRETVLGLVNKFDDLEAKVDTLTRGFSVHDRDEVEWRASMFGNLTPPIHIDDHSFVAEARNRRAEDRVLMTEAKKAAVGQGVKLLVAAVVGAVAAKYLGG